MLIINRNKRFTFLQNVSKYNFKTTIGFSGINIRPIAQVCVSVKGVVTGRRKSKNYDVG